jgi:hypothetical protein
MSNEIAAPVLSGPHVAVRRGEISLRAEGGGDDVSFYVEGGCDTFGGSNDAVRTGVTANPAQILSMFDDPFGGSLLASAVEADMGPVRSPSATVARFGGMS